MGKVNQQVTGVLLLDKPLELTANTALQKVKRLLCAKKAGHTGTLDPLATGMLPICLGKATKFSQYLLNADKYYLVEGTLGKTTETGDAEGDVLQQRPYDQITEAQLSRLLFSFQGEITQIPSMYSAIKHQGQPLYKLARQGITVERKPRKAMIYEIILRKFTPPTFEFEVHCGKGTYVRTLVEDLGEALGCGAYVSGLRRLSVAHFSVDQMVTLSELNELFSESMSPEARLSALQQVIYPVESLVENYPAVSISQAMLFYLQQGNSVLVPNAPTEGYVRLQLNDTLRFLGLGEVLSCGKIGPRRLVV